MLVVENTQEKVVGTVHLVTNENLFVAKSSPLCKSCSPSVCVWRGGGHICTQHVQEKTGLKCVCVFMRTHELWRSGERLENAFTVWSNSQACRQIHMSEQTPWAFRVKGKCKQTEAEAGDTSAGWGLLHHTQGGLLDPLWRGGGLEKRSLWGMRGRAECPPPPPL